MCIRDRRRRVRWVLRGTAHGRRLVARSGRLRLEDRSAGHDEECAVVARGPRAVAAAQQDHAEQHQEH
eukprot:8549244-Alexandrium_andersonii.AAC.1